MLDFGFYNMDCMEGMKQFPDKYFDLAIVDPPYGINIQKKVVDSEDTIQRMFGIAKYQVMTILMSYLGLAKIKSYGAVIIFL